MTNTRRSLLMVSFTLQASCSAYIPPASYEIPVPEPSVYTSLNCEEMVYKQNGYQQLLQNVATDHPTDAYKYAPSYQAQYQGLTNAINQRGCRTDAFASNGPSQEPKLDPAVSGNSSCVAWYSRQDLMEPASTSTGVVTKPWQAGPISSSPARTALSEFQAYMISRGTNDELGPVSCDTKADIQSCSATRAENGDFSHGSYTALVTCALSGVDKAQRYITTTYPLLQIIEWRPTGSTASVGGPAKSVTSEHASGAKPPAPLATSSSPGRESSVEDLVAKETVAKYQNRSCDYLHLAQANADKLSTSDVPKAMQVGQRQKSVVSQVLQQKTCPPLSPLSGRIGATIDTVDPVKATRLQIPAIGVWVENTLPGGQAEKAGITRGDVVVAINDKPIADDIDFRLAIGQSPLDSTVKLKIWRAQKFIEVPVLIGH